MSMHIPRYWVVTASADHARVGQELGMVQACHGKSAPLRRIKPGDRVAYYSPTVTFNRNGPRGEVCQAFTAVGTVAEGTAYQVEMAPDFHPYRRDVIWQAKGRAPIQPLLDRLSFTQNRRSWGYAFRFGLFPATEADLDLIAANLTPIV